MTQPAARPLRIRPTPVIGIVIGVAYMALFLILEAFSGVDYDDIGNSTDTVVDAIVIPLAIATALLFIVTSALGWWRPALFERERTAPGFLRAVPILLFVAVLAGINWGELPDLGGVYISWLVFGTAMVGFCEELAYRGLTLTGLRGGWTELQAWLVSSILFGLLHGVNVFIGQDLGPTVQQMLMAFLLGSLFYVVRRVTGMLFVAMAIHALWDFGQFTHAGDAVSATTQADLGALGPSLKMLLSAVAIVIALVGAKRLFATGTSGG